MKYVVCAWLGPTTSGRGHATCGACGWHFDDRNYGTVAMRALNHDRAHKLGSLP